MPFLKFQFPEKYEPVLDPLETQRAIKAAKDTFENALAQKMKLHRVTAPLFVCSGTGINDDLNGVEQPVRFNIRYLGQTQAEMVQSLAKWKRLMLAEFGLAPGEGIYTDMNAVRPDETLDAIHSVYVDQWDWERAISESERSLEYLKSTVASIFSALKQCESELCRRYPILAPQLPEAIHFIHSEELQRLHPGLSPAERENRICREWGAVFVIGIGARLADGWPHDLRAPDYDDWSSDNGSGQGLNGDILVWHRELQCALELSSMGIRVDPAALTEQLALCGAEGRRRLHFHRRLLAGELPPSIGGGIGQSRLCMFLLHKVHIGEVQAGIWLPEMKEEYRRKGVFVI